MPAIVIGLLAMVAGLVVRAVGVGQDEFPAGSIAAVAGLILGGIALVTGILAQPRFHGGLFVLPWWAAAGVAVVMATIALVGPDARVVMVPAALETAGGFALLLGLARWCEGTILLRHSWTSLTGQHKSEVHYNDDTSALVPASALIEKDEVRLQDGERLAVDGHLSSERGRIDESDIMGPGAVATKFKGDPVFAGTKAETPVRAIVAAPWTDSWSAQRDARHLKLLTSLLAPDRPGRVAAAACTLIGASVAGLAMTRLGPLEVASWLPTVAGVLLATVAVGPGLGRMRARLSFLHGLHQAGLVVTRMRDLRGLMRVRSWFVDPRLLSAPGPVTVVPMDDASKDELLRVSEAVLREQGGPLHASALAALRSEGISRVQSVALKNADEVYYGTIDGHRWFLGSVPGVKIGLQLEIKPSRAKLLGYFDDRDQEPWLIGREGVGIMGIVGIGITIDEDVQDAARVLGAVAAVSPAAGLRLAERAGLSTERRTAGPRDGTLVAERTAAPKAGMRLRVLSTRPARRLPLSGSPRLMRPALGTFAAVLPLLRTYLVRAGRNAWIATIAGMLAAALCALLWALIPAVGALVGAGVLIGALGLAPSKSESIFDAPDADDSLDGLPAISPLERGPVSAPTSQPLSRG